jgi:hypothetical protein
MADFLLEVLKMLVPLGLAYVGVLKTRADLDHFAASQRAKAENRPVEECLRRRWYHRVKRKREPWGR